MMATMLCENSYFSKLRRFNYKSVSEFDMRTVFKPNTNCSF